MNVEQRQQSFLHEVLDIVRAAGQTATKMGSELLLNRSKGFTESKIRPTVWTGSGGASRGAPPHRSRIQAYVRLGLLVICWIFVFSANGAEGEFSRAHSADPTQVQWVGRFESGLDTWSELRLPSGQKPNTFRVLQWDGVGAVEVTSDASMSLLARPIQVNLGATPVLCWRWRIGASLSQADMKKREGDDYAARVYVSFRLPVSSLSMGERAQLAVARAIWGQSVPDAAINYVWDNRQPVGTVRPNAYTDRTQMVVLRSGDADAGRWVWERVHVRNDVDRLFGHGAEAVQIAITADTDNTRSVARSGFADFHFVAAHSACHE